jgi:hypothetical protein
MMTHPRALQLATAAFLIVGSLNAAANVSFTASRPSFEALATPGTIDNYGFEDIAVDGSGAKSLDILNPWTQHGITYETVTGKNEIFSPDSGTGVTSNVLVSDTLGPVLITGSFVNQYQLFGFDFGAILGTSPFQIAITTNQGTYNFLSTPPLESSSTFLGFSTDSGEYFTSFSITNPNLLNLPAIDNVTVANVATLTPVPEPEVLAQLMAGLLVLAGLAKRRAP